jgi:hypothetical protein
MSAPLLDSQDDWPPDFPKSKSIFLGRAAARVAKVDLWAAIRSGELELQVYTVGRDDLDPIELSPMQFMRAIDFMRSDGDLSPIDVREHILGRYQVDVREKDFRRPAAIRRAIPVPHWLYVTRDSLDKFVKSRPTATVAAEARAIEHLAGILKRDRKLTKAQARAACDQFGLSGQGFEDRVWPQARVKAKLSARAPAGRKSRSESRT